MLSEVRSYLGVTKFSSSFCIRFKTSGLVDLNDFAYVIVFREALDFEVISLSIEWSKDERTVL